MTILKLFYAAKSNGEVVIPEDNLHNLPKSVNCLMDPQYYISQMRGRSIICMDRFWEKYYEILQEANFVSVYNPNPASGKIHIVDGMKSNKWRPSYTILETLDKAHYYSGYCFNGKYIYSPEILCVGDNNALEAFAPFASAIRMIQIWSDNPARDGGYYIPHSISAQFCAVDDDGDGERIWREDGVNGLWGDNRYSEYYFKRIEPINF